MTSTVWTSVVALTILGFIGSPSPRSRAAVPPVGYPGGPPDTLIVNPRASAIHWKGSGLGGLAVREGAVGMGKGMFIVRHEQLTKGILLIDMRQLEGALRKEELFDVARYPTAVFTSTGMQRLGQARWQVSGNLEMRGVSRPVTFETDVRWEELGHMVATSTFTIDRREWGIGTRGTGVANDVVDSDIQLSITLDARRKQAAMAAR
jgi:hypothetical protein